jgi:hypothetical protein
MIGPGRSCASMLWPKHSQVNGSRGVGGIQKGLLAKNGDDTTNPAFPKTSVSRRPRLREKDTEKSSVRGCRPLWVLESTVSMPVAAFFATVIPSGSPVIEAPRRRNKSDHISRCLIEERAQPDRGNLRSRQGEPHFSFAQLFFDLVEEVAALEASVAHRKSQGTIEARIIQAQERIECREARWLPRTAIRE